MNTTEIAQKLVAHCRNHTEKQGLEELYSEKAVSLEAGVPDGMDKMTKGREGIAAKHDWWNENMEVHGVEIEGPFVNENLFTVIFAIDATDKSTGKRFQMREIALYEVDQEKIVKETFFMQPQG